MTSIKKDLRELAKNWTSGYSGEDCTAELESLIPRIVAAVEQPGPCGKPYHLQANQYPYRVGQGGLGTYCTVCEAIEQAQAEAIQSAVDICSRANAARGYAIAGVVAALTPRRVQIEAELRERMSRLHEARLAHQKIKDYWEGSPDRSDVHCNGTFLLEIRVNELLREIATLERELEAERKGVGQ